MNSNSIAVDLDDELYVPASAEFSPMRKLALAVLAQAVDEVEGRCHRHPKTGHVGSIADNAFEWLHRWHLVEPWCLVAEISPGQLKRRIQMLERQQDQLAA